MANTTQVTLIMRLRQRSDSGAWSQFVDLYGPLIYRYGRRRGLQDADSADLTQDVLREVARSIGRFEYDPSLGRFRDWLFVVAQRRLSHMFRSAHRQPAGSGDTAVLATLHQVHAPEEEQEAWEEEHRRHLFTWASEQIRSEFQENTWDAFWRTAIEGQKPAEVAEALGMNVGSVYVAKNRVLARLRNKIATIEAAAERDL